ncbi:BOI2 [Symbiodinium sp. CCMP2592]|nr:BOI2 [Symbiodinium sp. CCMP2592]
MLREATVRKVLNIDTNAIQPLTLESIAKGTSVNQALQDVNVSEWSNHAISNCEAPKTTLSIAGARTGLWREHTMHSQNERETSRCRHRSCAIRLGPTSPKHGMFFISSKARYCAVLQKLCTTGPPCALDELRCNNTASGRLVTEAFLHALKCNPMMCKLGYAVTDAYFRGEIDKQLTRNNDAARKRRLEEKRRKEAAEAEALGVENQSPSAKTYPKVRAQAKVSWPPKAPETLEAAAELSKEPLKEQEAADAAKEAEEATLPLDVVEEKETDVDMKSNPSNAKIEPQKADASKTSTEKSEKAQSLWNTSWEERNPAESLDESSEVKKTTQTIESFLAEPLDALPGMVDGRERASAKADFRGYLYKKSPATLRMKAWDWRFFVIHGRRLVWWRRDRDVPESAEELKQPDPPGCKGFIDFMLSRARVVPDEKNPTLFILEAVDGVWKDGSLKDMSDAQRMFEFDCADSAHTREQWIAALRKLQA